MGKGSSMLRKQTLKANKTNPFSFKFLVFFFSLIVIWGILTHGVDDKTEKLIQH